MAHPVQHHLRDRAAPLYRLIAGFIIDGLGQAQQRPLLIEVVAAEHEAPGRPQRFVRKRQSGVDELRLVADRLHVIERGAAGGLDQDSFCRHRTNRRCSRCSGVGLPCEEKAGQRGSGAH